MSEASNTTNALQEPIEEEETLEQLADRIFERTDKFYYGRVSKKRHVYPYMGKHYMEHYHKKKRGVTKQQFIDIMEKWGVPYSKKRFVYKIKVRDEYFVKYWFY